MSLPYKEYWYDWGGFNGELFMSIYKSGVDDFAGLMPYLDYIGEYKNFPQIGIALALFLLLKLGYRKARGFSVGSLVLRSYAAWLLALFFGFFAMAFIVGGIKYNVDFMRPHFYYNTVALLYGLPDKTEAYQSLPSGHVAFTTFWVSLLWFQVWGLMRPMLLLIIFAMCWFRIAIGAHYPADIVASLIIGYSCAIMARSFFNARLKVWK